MYKCKKCGKEFKNSQACNGHSGSCKKKVNYNPWNKGLTKDSDNRVKEYSKKLSEYLTGRSGHKQTVQTRKQISLTARKNKLSGGYRKGSGIGKSCWYKSKIAGNVFLDSSYELRLAKLFDKFNILWERNNNKFQYTYQGKIKNYIPDFYLPEIDKYIETKGYKTEKDEAKWNQFPEKLLILYNNDIEKLEGHRTLGVQQF